MSQHPNPGPMNYEVPPEASPVEPNQDARSMAMLIYLLAILTFFIGPLIIWLMKKDQSRFIDHHGKEVINFEIVVTIATVVLGPLTCGIGSGVVWVLALIFLIIGAMAANRGEWYRIPLNLRIIK